MNTSALENSRRGKRCFILGNGPSLKHQDLSFLRDEHVFVTNWFVLQDEFPKLRHCYLCVSDPHFWNFGEGLHPEMVEPVAAKSDLLAFFEQGAREPVERTKLRVHLDRVFFIRLNTGETVDHGFFSTNVPARLNLGFTVIIDLCLPIAYHLGFTECYLMGCDCDYKLNGGNDLSQSFFRDRGEARQWFNKAVQWMQKNQPTDPELLQFRAEASKLLGLPDTQTAGKKDGK